MIVIESFGDIAAQQRQLGQMTSFAGAFVWLSNGSANRLRGADNLLYFVKTTYRMTRKLGLATLILSVNVSNFY